ncbi:hypothetical protein DFH11DRAFT_1686364 [Phellopilus nigrolimitatus]|nr:hypothetical protein DFH11DRAFT_1686364 [Phellopilus nigrolimitatus]
MNGKPLPTRPDGLRSTAPAAEIALLGNLPDELHDMRRVQAYGQEEDLKEALGKMIGRVEELSSMLSQAHRTQTELETSLKLTRSNLQLALANNEMLEDALKRESATGSKDVGWRRRSDRPESRQGIRKEQDSTERPPSRQSGGDASSSSVLSTPTSEASASSPPPVKPTSPPPPVVHDSRFFRFRFGSSSASTSPNLNAHAGPASRPQSPTLRKHADVIRDRDASHLTSASLPSLVANTNKREEELVAELESERAKYTKVVTEKSTLEQELEGLSQALFEEANKMVAHERIKCAEIEAELRQIRQEKDALRGAMRIIEQENSRLKSPALTQSPQAPDSYSGAANEFANDITPHDTRPPSRAGARSSSSGLRTQSPTPSMSPSEGSMSMSSSVQGCRSKSSESERGWASPEPELEGSAEHVLELEEQETKTGFEQTEKERKSGAEAVTEARFSVPVSPLPDMPVEESPWAQ